MKKFILFVSVFFLCSCKDSLGNHVGETHHYSKFTINTGNEYVDKFATNMAMLGADSVVTTLGINGGYIISTEKTYKKDTTETEIHRFTADTAIKCQEAVGYIGHGYRRTIEGKFDNQPDSTCMYFGYRKEKVLFDSAIFSMKAEDGSLFKIIYTN